MSFIDAVKSCFTQYVGFSGRARRSEYWYFTLFNLLGSMVFSILAQALGIPAITGIFSLAVFLPGLAVSIRRLHDIGKSGWWILIELIPIVGLILIIIWLCKDSDPADNQYGPNPKNASPMM